MPSAQIDNSNQRREPTTAYSHFESTTTAPFYTLEGLFSQEACSGLEAIRSELGISLIKISAVGQDTFVGDGIEMIFETGEARDEFKEKLAAEFARNSRQGTNFQLNGSNRIFDFSDLALRINRIELNDALILTSILNRLEKHFGKEPFKGVTIRFAYPRVSSSNEPPYFKSHANAKYLGLAFPDEKSLQKVPDELLGHALDAMPVDIHIELLRKRFFSNPGTPKFEPESDPAYRPFIKLHDYDLIFERSGLEKMLAGGR